MARLMLLFDFAALLAASVQGYDCPISDADSVLQPGHEYLYSFQTEALGEAVGTTDDRSKLLIHCSVHISHAHDCYFALQLEDCAVSANGGPPQSETAWIDEQSLPELSVHPILFAISSGEVAEVLSAEDDPIYFINIKRGALSAFVFKLSSTVDEVNEMHTDVHGVCPVSSVPVNGVEGSVKTTKDMTNCAFPSRPDWQLSPWSMFWNMSFIQYVINSTTECDYKIDLSDRRIESVLCKERHAIMLESTHRTTTAVQTNINYSLKHVRSGLLKEPSNYQSLTHRTGIQFEYEETPVPISAPEDFMPKAKKMISDLVLDSVDEIRLFSITQFTEFMNWMRSSPNLIPFTEIVKACSFLPSGVLCTDSMKDLAMAYLSDALVQCNTVPCFKAITHLAENHDLSPSYLKFVLYSWSNMHFTQPAIIKQIKNICSVEQSQFCWMVLATVSRNFYEGKNIVKIPEELKEVTNYFYDSIGENCNGPNNIFQDNKENVHHLLALLKAVENMGNVYSIIAPNALTQIFNCITSDNLPSYLRSTALQTLDKMDACYDDSSCSYQHKRLLPLLMNSSISLNVRSGAYDQLIKTPESYNLQQDLLKIFTKSDSNEMRAYIASRLRNALSCPLFKKNHAEFVDSMKDSLEKNEVSLDDFIYNPSTQSTYTSSSSFMKLPFLPERLQKFGVQLQESSIYHHNALIPQTSRSNITLQLFNKMINLLQVGGNFEGWESLMIVLQKIFEDMDPDANLFDMSIEDLVSELAPFLSSQDSTIQESYLSANVANGIKKIHELYRSHKPELKQFFDIYFSMFGSTLNFFTIHDLFALQSKVNDYYDYMDMLSEGLIYNTTRMISIIEAYHQVPTLMGLPLNWTTDATLGLSMRRGMTLQLDSEQNKKYADGFYHPSAALTFLNRMVLDFPGVTKMGVQANSSAYTSTQWEAQYLDSGSHSMFKLSKPTKPQKFLELFRTNQLIKHDSYIDIADWNIERSSSSWCSENPLGSVLGLRLCVDKSYPKVTHLMKPWALMAGWCKWRLVVEPFNEEVNTYDFEVKKHYSEESSKLQLKINTSGSSKRQDLVVISFDSTTTGDIALQLNSPLVEDFTFNVSKNNVWDNNKLSGSRVQILSNLAKHIQYKLTYNNEGKTEKRRESSASKNKSSSNKRISTLVREATVVLETPYNNYKWDRKVHSAGENKKVDVMVSYENLKPHANWLKQILPPTFWQTDSKAWLRSQINYKAPVYPQSGTVIRQSSVYVSTPQSNAEFVFGSHNMAGREQIVMNATKIDTASKKLLTFANFTYDFWCSEGNQQNSKRVSVFILTLPQRSWALQWQKITEDNTLLYELMFTRAQMKSKNGEEIDYVGWWSEDQKDNFNLREQQFKFKAKIHSEILSTEALVERYSTLTANEMHGLKNKLITADVALHIPLSKNVQSLIYDGYFILSRGTTTFRFQKNFVLSSSYHNLQLTSHSVYRMDSHQTTLLHNSFFTEMTSGKKAFNTIQYKRDYQRGKCLEVEFKHDIKSEVFDLSTDASYKCHSSDLNLHVLLLNLTTHSSYWDKLNLKLVQSIKDINPEYTEESVNITHPLMTINVSADWRGPMKDHSKNVIFNSLGSVPSMQLNIESLHNGVKKIKLNIDDNLKTELYYGRRISNDYKNLDVVIGHSDVKSEPTDALVLRGLILDQKKRIWRGEIDGIAYRKINALLRASRESISDTFGEIAKDREHPLNKMLEPTIKMSLYDYWNNVKSQFKGNATSLWREIKSTVSKLEPFYKPTQTIFTNAFYKLMNVCSQAFLAVKDKSITIWAINYFHIPYYIQQTIVNFPQNARNMLTWFMPEDHLFRFEFEGSKLFEWGSYREWPRFSLKQIRVYFPRFFPEEEPQIKPRHRLGDGSKVAMIFGPQHVYTFDGVLYDVPAYESEECAFLLAHDVHKSMFTVLSTAEVLHVVFPEMTISVNSKNEVYVNGSQSQQVLPVESFNRKVTVKRGDFIEIWSPSLRVLCDGKNFLCTFELTHWHSAGTIGLLGNADGQSDNDYILPNGETASNFMDFVRQYELSGKLGCKNFHSIHSIASSKEEKESCLRALQSVCPRHIDLQKQFLEACLSDLKNGQGACYAESGLSALCFYKNGDETSKCSAAVQESSKIRHKLEVVLVVNQLTSMSVNGSKGTPHKGLESVISALDAQFLSNGYSSIFYSLVGFGGNGVYKQPSVYSTGSNPWMPLRRMIEGIKYLQFNGTERVSNVESLLYVTETLGFDTFDSKIIIMFTDKDEQVANKINLEEVQHHLNRNGITLYTISSYPSIEKGKKVYGVRADGFLFPSAEGEAAYLEYPKGDVAKLSAGTRGSAFLYKFVRNNGPTAFFGEFAQEVWAKVRKEVHSCRLCKTVRSTLWFSYNECSLLSC